MNRRIIGAYHVATFPGWEQVVVGQCHRLRKSGLLAATDQVHVGIVGEFEPAASTISLLLEGKARLVECGDVSRFEFPTLNLLYQQSLEHQFLAWYIHTKGVSHDLASSHRLQMEAIVIDDHVGCRSHLEDHDASGPGWQTTGFGLPNPHFSGNFWWATSDYLRTLPPPESLNTAVRYEAEFWIGKNPEIRPYRMPWTESHQQRTIDPFAKPSAWVGLESKYRELCEIDQPEGIQRIVDIGVDYGYSTFHMARDFPNSDVVGVSNFELHGDSEGWVRAHLQMFPNIRLLCGDSPTLGKDFGQPIDLLHIDGDHSYDGVKSDFVNWVNWVRPGGRVIFHDTESFSTVRQFFDELPGRKKEIKEHHGLGCWFKGA